MGTWQDIGTEEDAMRVGAIDTKAKAYLSLPDKVASPEKYRTGHRKTTIHKTENTITARLKQIPEELLKCVKTTRPYHYSLKLSALDSTQE